MNNTRTIAALEKTIAQLSAIKDRLAAADAKSGTSAVPAKKAAAKKPVVKKAPAAKKPVVKKVPATKKAAKKTT